MKFKHLIVDQFLKKTRKELVDKGLSSEAQIAQILAAAREKFDGISIESNHVGSHFSLRHKTEFHVITYVIEGHIYFHNFLYGSKRSVLKKNNM